MAGIFIFKCIGIVLCNRSNGMVECSHAWWLHCLDDWGPSVFPAKGRSPAGTKWAEPLTKPHKMPQLFNCGKTPDSVLVDEMWETPAVVLFKILWENPAAVLVDIVWENPTVILDDIRRFLTLHSFIIFHHLINLHQQLWDLRTILHVLIVKDMVSIPTLM